MGEARATPKISPPVMLTRNEALTYAANKLRGMADAAAMMALLIPALGDATLMHDEFPPRLRKIQEVYPAPDLQEAALRAAAKAIDDMVLEDRLVTARVAAGAGVRP